VLASFPDGRNDAANERVHAAFSAFRADLAVQILRGHYIQGSLRPADGNSHVLLLEHNVSLRIVDARLAFLPGHSVERMDAFFTQDSINLESRMHYGVSGHLGPPFTVMRAVACPG
jgi:hypothetical protein